MAPASLSVNAKAFTPPSGTGTSAVDTAAPHNGVQPSRSAAAISDPAPGKPARTKSPALEPSSTKPAANTRPGPQPSKVGKPAIFRPQNHPHRAPWTSGPKAATPPPTTTPLDAAHDPSQGPAQQVNGAAAAAGNHHAEPAPHTTAVEQDHFPPEDLHRCIRTSLAGMLEDPEQQPDAVKATLPHSQSPRSAQMTAIAVGDNIPTVPPGVVPRAGSVPTHPFLSPPPPPPGGPGPHNNNQYAYSAMPVPAYTAGLPGPHMVQAVPGVAVPPHMNPAAAARAVETARTAAASAARDAVVRRQEVKRLQAAGYMSRDQADAAYMAVDYQEVRSSVDFGALRAYSRHLAEQHWPVFHAKYFRALTQGQPRVPPQVYLQLRRRAAALALQEVEKVASRHYHAMLQRHLEAWATESW